MYPMFVSTIQYSILYTFFLHQQNMVLEIFRREESIAFTSYSPLWLEHNSDHKITGRKRTCMWAGCMNSLNWTTGLD